jgi:predicted  nucleic acid-binding Zn-ribbon protein
MRAFVYKVEHNKALKTKAKAGYTRKVVSSDWEKPKTIIKMPTKIPKETPAAVPKKQLKGRNVKAPIQKHVPVYKTGAAKRKVYKGFLVTGNTYPLKNQIKAMGGKWSKDEGGWAVPATASAAKQINALRKAKGLKISPLRTDENVFRRLTEAERLDIRTEKYAKKVERWENKANKLKIEESRLHKAADDVFSNIPFGQPLLVDHYSYKTDRNRRDRAWNNLGKAVHAGEEADKVSRKAGILSNVIDKIGTASDLKGRIAKLEKEYNHAKNKVTQAERDLEFARQRKSAEDIERLKRDIGYWQRTAENLQADIASIKERIPADAVTKQVTGVSMVMLGGTKLKPLVGATSVAKRYHNKNLSGGNFGIEVRKGDAAVELQGYHNTDGIITSLRVGPLFSPGTPIIKKDNYESFEVSRLADIVKKALAAFKK